MKKGFLLVAIAALFINTTNAQQWTEVTTFNQVINDLAVFDGKLFIGGGFTKREGATCYWSAYYNGSSFQNHTSLVGGAGLRTFEVFDNELYAAGSMQIDGSLGVARWDNTSAWENEGSFSVSHTGIYADGNVLYVGSDQGQLRSRTISSGYSLVVDFGSGIGNIIKYNGDLIVTGGFTSYNGTTLNKITRWDGTDWQPLGDGVSGGSIGAMAVYNNELYVAGTFNSAGGQNIRQIAKWNGTTWSDVGGSVNAVGLSNGIQDMLVYNNELYVVGDFTEIGGVQAKYAAKWNGTTWTALSINNATDFPSSIAAYNDYLYVGTVSFDTSQLLRMSVAPVMSVDEVLATDAWSVYPNPASNMFQVEMSNPVEATIEIRDISGKLLQQQYLAGQSSIDCEGLGAGLYFVSLRDTETGALLGVKRLVKE